MDGYLDGSTDGFSGRVEVIEGRAAVARDERRAQREKADREEQERVQAEAVQHQAAADAAATAKVEVREKRLNDRAHRVVEDEANRKAERDRHYANRKGRQRG